MSLWTKQTQLWGKVIGCGFILEYFVPIKKMYGAWFDEFSNQFLVVFYEPDMLNVNIWISEAKTMTSLTTK